ncbi:MAG: HAMP domain-containing protein [Oscillospiraceae bacterium]|nr:HAMP domain-containing protein [Oscillospiraceae bacterium]
MKKQKRLSLKVTGLRRRWLINTLCVVLPLAIVCVLAVTAAFAAYYYSGMESDLRYRARTTTDFFAENMNVDYNAYYKSCVKYAQTYEDRNSIELQFINSRGQIVASSYGPWVGDSPSTSEIREAMDTRTQRAFVGVDVNTGEHIMAVSSPMVYSNGEVIGVLRFVTGTRVMHMQIMFIAAVALAFFTGFVLIIVLLTNYYIHTVLVPVADITEKAQRIATGSYGIQITAKYDDEFGVLADTINEMSNKISQNEKVQTDFISSLSHELRTPLTAITGWSETLLDGNRMDREARRGMDIIMRESKRLTEMVLGLLEFSRIEGDRMTLNVEIADIRAEFEDTIFMYGSRLRQEGIELCYFENEEEIPEIPCDPKRLRQVFLNILDNAAKHGGDGKTIDTSICCTDTDVIIEIRDYGPGIPEDELPLVKKKFYKGSSKARGTGIGLAVCDEIVTMHNGTLELSNAEGGGTRVRISLPIE